MKDNSLKRDGGSIRQGAEEINPADYPLRSPESRAAARALVSQRTALSPADSDALTLYRAGHWLSTQELRPLEATAVYQRGKELHLRLFGSTRDEYEGDDPLCQRKDRTLPAFEFVFHRDPKPGDILRSSELIECWRSRLLADLTRRMMGGSCRSGHYKQSTYQPKTFPQTVALPRIFSVQVLAQVH